MLPATAVIWAASLPHYLRHPAGPGEATYVAIGCADDVEAALAGLPERPVVVARWHAAVHPEVALGRLAARVEAAGGTLARRGRDVLWYRAAVAGLDDAAAAAGLRSA